MTVSQRREREREERQAAIVDAAEEIFVERGYWAATMEQVATRAELSKGTLYLYFKSKDDLLISIGSRVLETVINRFREIETDPPGSGAELLRELLLAYAGTALSRPERFRIAIGWLVAQKGLDVSTPAFRAHRERIAGAMSHLVNAIQQGMDDGSLRAGDDPCYVATYAWASMVGALVVRSNAKPLSGIVEGQLSSRDQVAEFIEKFVDTLVTGLRVGEKRP